MKILTAEQLEVGMVYVQPASSLNPFPEPREITSVRTVRYVETYQVLETRGVCSGLRGDINLRHGSMLTYHVVENVAPRDVAVLSRGGIEPGTQVTIHRTIDGRLWA